LPDLNPYIEKTVAGYGGKAVPVAATLDQAASVPRARNCRRVNPESGRLFIKRLQL